MVDVVGYMQIIQKDGEEKRVIMADASDGRYVSKDRTGKLGKYIKPEFAYVKNLLSDKKTVVVQTRKRTAAATK